MMHRVAVIQMTSTENIARNLADVQKRIQEAVNDGAKLIVLPENFAIMGDEQTKLKHKETFGAGTIQGFLKKQAMNYGVWIVGGTIPLEILNHADKVYAACLVFDDHGECVAQYNKIHLFDVAVPKTSEKHFESKTIFPGHDIVVIDTPLGKLGLAVCYDVRFPELFRAMQAKGAEIIALPSAFTVPTGLAHWDVLVRARAIENQIYMLAAAQTGIHPNQRKTYGHSMIVNPWGEVTVCLPDNEGQVTTDVDLSFLHQLRQDFPVLQHRRH